ncbi:MAG: hypothetical protein ACO4CG_08665 [Prochlorothrix sp.]|nr:hypothetical protein [Prochlorothrix sp.]
MSASSQLPFLTPSLARQDFQGESASDLLQRIAINLEPDFDSGKKIAQNFLGKRVTTLTNIYTLELNSLGLIGGTKLCRKLKKANAPLKHLNR